MAFQILLDGAYSVLNSACAESQNYVDLTLLYSFNCTHTRFHDVSPMI